MRPDLSSQSSGARSSSLTAPARSTARSLSALALSLVALSSLIFCSGCEDTARDVEPAASDRAARDQRSAEAEHGPREDHGPLPDQRPAVESCRFPADCPGGDCIEGVCWREEAQLCEGDEDCVAPARCLLDRGRRSCAEPCVESLSCPQPISACRTHFQCPWGMVCLEDRCINACATDLDCAAGGHCVEGVCEAYPTELFDAPPGPATATAGRLSVGIGVEAFDFPLGVSLGAYGGREGADTPYAISLGGSDRIFERQEVKAMAFDDGETRVLLLRIPLAWTSDFLRSLVAVELRALTGFNYLDQLLLFATHSHSQPARFWNLVPELRFEGLGYGRFSITLARRYARSIARAAQAAIEDLRPARVGHLLLDAVDPERRAHADRRPASPPSVDDRLLLLRVDELDGTPRGALIGFALHGTFLSGSWMSGDAPAGIERLFMEALSQQSGRPVEVLFANGNAGDLSPVGGGISQSHGKLQRVGQRVAELALPRFEEIESAPGRRLRHRTLRLPLSYDTLGYQRSPVEFADPNGELQLFGGFRCLVNERPWEEPAYPRDALGCAFNILKVYRAPVLQFTKTSLSVLQIGSLLLTTLPGEPSSALGLRLSQEVVAAAAERGREVESFNIGYAMDFLFYLLDEEDWLHGGYESSMQLWGWRIGRALVQRAVELAEALLDDAPASAARSPAPTWWPRLEEDEGPPLTEDPRGAGLLLEGSAPVWPRGSLQQLTWVGGHPGIDLPQLSLERWEGVEEGEGEEGEGEEGEWRPATHPDHGLPFDDRGFESLLHYQGDYEGDHRWALRWELPFSLPLGTYRLCARGRGGLDPANPRPYEVCGGAAELRPVTLLLHRVARAGDTLQLTLGYPHGPSTDSGGAPFTTLKATGHWLRHRVDAPLPGALRAYALLLSPPLTAPLTLFRAGESAPLLSLRPQEAPVTLSLVTSRNQEGGEERASVDWRGGQIEIPLTALELSEGEALSVEDPWGNSATLSIPGD